MCGWVAFISVFALGLASGVSFSHLLQLGPKRRLAPAQFLAVQQLLLRNYGPAIGRQFLDVRIASLEWMKLRDRWHLLHAVRFVLSAIAFTASIGGLCARTS